MRKLAVVVLFVVFALLVSGCFGPTDTQEDEAIFITRYGEVKEVKLGGGRHMSMEPGVEGQIVSLVTYEETFVTLSIPEYDCVEGVGNGKAWTKDSQPIIMSVAVKYHITRTDENLQRMWEQDKKLLNSSSTLREAVCVRTVAEIKEISTRFTLPDMVGIQAIGQPASETPIGREEVVKALDEELRPELNQLGVTLVSLRIVNVDPADDEYEALLNEAAKAKAREQAADQNLAVKRKEQESAAIDNEIREDRARSDAEVRRISAEVYQDDRVFQLELAQKFADAINRGDAIIFVPEGEDFTYILNGNTGNVVPLD